MGQVDLYIYVNDILDLVKKNPTDLGERIHNILLDIDARAWHAGHSEGWSDGYTEGESSIDDVQLSKAYQNGYLEGRNDQIRLYKEDY